MDNDLNKRKNGKKVTKPVVMKAYDNQEFIHSNDARDLRILAEYQYPLHKFRQMGIYKTIIFFGSARTPSREKFDLGYNELKSRLENNTSLDRDSIESEMESFLHKRDVINYYNDAYELSKMITEWNRQFPRKKRYHICTGGGPGIMEAANRGAHDAGGLSIGLNISLPFEQEPNPYISPGLNFEFHYFFMRKFWLVYLAQALIVFPGGFGTLDELSEILTLRQTGKMSKPRTIMLYNENFWHKAVNFDYLAEMGMINREDLDLMYFFNTPGQGFEILKTELEKNMLKKAR
jgi:uncharacterized protein (TIGR00730 family)